MELLWNYYGDIVVILWWYCGVIIRFICIFWSDGSISF